MNMPCYRARSDDGSEYFICGRNLDLGPTCHDCGYVSDYLCDYPVGYGKTCDRPMCEKHAHEIGPDLHYCQAHFAEWKKYKESGGLSMDLENVFSFKRK